MAKTKYLEKLQKLEGAVLMDEDPFDDVLRSPSPSLNFVFGNSWGIPLGYSAILWGPPKSGKSLVSYAMIAQLHKDDPEAFAVRFDTEMRGKAQLTAKTARMYGIDTDRLVNYEVNEPAFIFDRIEKDLLAMIQDGCKIKLIIIDSISGIRGRREMNADTIETQQIGDQALTLKDGFKRILPVIRRNKIALLLTAQVTAEMDPIEQRRGNKYKMGAANAVQHFAEYFLYVEENRTKEGRSDLLGQEFVNDNLSDLMDKSEKTGHRIRVKMINNTLGPKGRSGEFTFDYARGIINVHEEVFRLGVNRGLIHRPNNTSYEYNGAKWVGKPAALEAIKNSQELQQAIVLELIERDRNGLLGEEMVILDTE